MSTMVRNCDLDNEETVLENAYSPNILDKRNKISSLLETVIENQHFLKMEIAGELEKSRAGVREDFSFHLQTISDKINRYLNSPALNLSSAVTPNGLLLRNDFKSSPQELVSANEVQLVAVEPADIDRTYWLATKLMESQCTLRDEVFHQLQSENEKMRKEIKEMVRRSEEVIDRRLYSIEQRIERTMSYLLGFVNQFHELGDTMDQVLSQVDAKVVELQNKLENVTTCSNVLVSTLMKGKQTEEILRDTFHLSSASSVRTDVNSIIDDASSICSFNTDASSCLQDIKELVTRQNRKLLSSSAESVKYRCKSICTCHEEPLKISENILAAWDAEAKKIDYDENLFWSTIDSYSVPYIADDTLNMYIKTLVILSVTVHTEIDFYNMVTFCAVQLRNPSCPSSLVIAARESDTNEGTTIPEPYIDWSTIFANSDEIFASLTDEEKQLVEKVMAMPEETVAVWGTAYACLLLRLHEKGPVYVMDKLKKLNEELASVYEIQVDEFPAIPQCDQFFNRLKIYSKYELERKSRDTVYKGMIERYESQETTTSTKHFLNFLLLKSLRYKGMPLLTLVDEVVKLYGIEFLNLMQNTSFCKTIDSWKTFYQFVFSAIYYKYKKWKYCVNFDPEAFPDLRFAVNRKLCSLLSALIDVSNVKNRKSKILYSRLIKKHKPEWALDNCETKYLKASLKLLKRSC